jgi:3-deoxy-7-phosphoheptulonate synthase
VAAGADALLIEIHPNADKSVSDAAQTMYLEDFAKLTTELRLIAAAVGRTL